jgi:intracellular septation protein
MQWGSLALVIVLGGATITTRDGHFIMIKPSIIHFAVAAIMLRRGWMGRYLPRIATDNLPESIIVGAG